MKATSTQPLRELWYYAVPSKALKRRQMVAKTMLGEPVLLGRDNQGTAFAIRDLCPHRGIPLRFGRFDGAEIECYYHGWRFGTDGVCRSIPSLVDSQRPEPGGICVQRYPVEEAQGNVWVFFGKHPETAPPVPVVPELEGLAPKLHERMIFPSDIDHAVIGLMDPAHGTYVHRSWFWRKSAIEKHKAFAPSPWGFTMTRHAPSSNARAYQLLGAGNGRTTEISFRLPGVRIEMIHAGRHKLCNLTTITPVGEQETEINHTIYWTSAFLTLLRPVLRPFVRAFLDQDRQAVALQQEGLRFDPHLMLLGDPDAQARWYFSLKQEFRRAQEEGRSFNNPVTAQILHWRS